MGENSPTDAIIAATHPTTIPAAHTPQADDAAPPSDATTGMPIAGTTATTTTAQLAAANAPRTAIHADVAATADADAHTPPNETAADRTSPIATDLTDRADTTRDAATSDLGETAHTRQKADSMCGKSARSTLTSKNS